MGNTVAVTGWKGELLEQYRYDAFGKPKIMGPGGEPLDETKINNNLLFNGREWVSRFGFYENRSRAYHPGLGRFMSEDPLGFAGGNNLFRYCGNDPLNFSDPSGGIEEPEKMRDSNGWGNSHDSHSPISLRGFWGNPDGTPTGPWGAGGSGPDSTNQGGNRGSGSGVSYGAIWGTVERVVVTEAGSFFIIGKIFSDNLGFRPDQVSTSPNSLGSLYDYGWLNRQLHQAGDIHRDQINSLQQFGKAISTATTVYVSVTIGGGTLLEAAVAAGAGPAIASAAVRGYTAAYVHAPIICASAYGTAVIGTGTVKPNLAHEVLVEIIEFEVGQPGRGIPGRWP